MDQSATCVHKLEGQVPLALARVEMGIVTAVPHLWPNHVEMKLVGANVVGHKVAKLSILGYSVCFNQ